MRHLDVIPRTRRHPGPVGWFALAIGVLVAAALALLWCFLADYQASLPKNFAAQILTAYQTEDLQTIKKYSVNLPEPLRNPARFTQYYEDNIDLSSLYFYPGAAAGPEECSYEFVSGSSPVATLTLRKTGQTSRFGFPKYEISALTGHPLVSYRITAPADTVLFINGILLSERYRTPEEVVPGGTPAPSKAVRTKSYQTNDFVYIEELGVFSGDGCDCSVTWSEDHRTARVEKQMSEALQSEISAFAVKFSQTYSVFATRRHGPRYPVEQLLEAGTPFHRALQLYNNDWGELYTTDRYDNRVIDRFVQYSPTEFSCDIRFDYVIQLPDGFEKSYPYYMTYYLTNRSGRLLLEDMQPNTN